MLLLLYAPCHAQVRLEVEARLAQEKREKEAKRLAAEQRRAAVVER